MEPTLLHQLFTAADSLPEELARDQNALRGILEQEVQDAGGYWSRQVEDYVDMLLAEFCEPTSRAA